MRRSTINVTTFKLFKKGTTTQIAAQVSYNADTDMAKLDPTNLLKEGVAYKVVVTTWAKDVAENRLDEDSSTTGLQQKMWYFEIRRLETTRQPPDHLGRRRRLLGRAERDLYSPECVEG